MVKGSVRVIKTILSFLCTIVLLLFNCYLLINNELKFRISIKIEISSASQQLFILIINYDIVFYIIV